MAQHFLRVAMVRPDGAEYADTVYALKRLLVTMQTPEDEIRDRVRSAVEHQKQDMMKLGFTDEEAEEKIQDLIDDEMDRAPEVMKEEVMEEKE